MGFRPGEEVFYTRVKVGGALDGVLAGRGGVLDQGEGRQGFGWGFGWVRRCFRPERRWAGLRMGFPTCEEVL
jgi:hypothetical protein